MAGPLVPAKVGSTQQTNFSSVASINQSFTVNTTGNTLVVAVFNKGITTAFASTAVSGCGATWFRAGWQAATAGAIDVWIGINATSGAGTIAITINGTNTAACMADEWSGLTNSALITAWLNSWKVGSSGTSTTPSVTPAQTDLNQLVFAYALTTNTITGSPSGVYTAEAGPTNGGNQQAGAAYWVTTTLTSTAASWTQSSATWTTAAVVLNSRQDVLFRIWNDPSAATNPAVLTPQSAPDMLDFEHLIQAIGDTGVLTGCAAGPNTGSDFNWQNLAGTVLINAAPIAVAAHTSQAITAADATNPRKDLVYVDPSGNVKYLAGTPAALPCTPQPASQTYVPLMEIYVPANATVFDNGTSTANAHPSDKRVQVVWGAGAPDMYAAPTTAGIPNLATNSRRIDASTNSSALSTGVCVLRLIWLPAGYVIGHIDVVSATTGASTPTHYWCVLCDQNLNQLAATADQTTTAWAASTEKNLAIASTIHNSSGTTYVAPYSGYYYIGLMVAASTVPTMVGPPVSTNTVLYTKVPIYNGRTGSSLTAVPAYPNTFGALTANGNSLHVAVGN